MTIDFLRRLIGTQEIHQKLDQLIGDQKNIMKELNDLKAQVAGLSADTDAELAAIQAKLAAAPAGASAADLQSVTDSLAAIRTKLQTETAALTQPSVATPAPVAS